MNFLVDPAAFLEATLEQNKEVMGPKRQVFPRFADPDDGTLKNPMMEGVAADPSFEIPREVSPQQVRDQINRRVISDYDRKERNAPSGIFSTSSSRGVITRHQ